MSSASRERSQKSKLLNMPLRASSLDSHVVIRARRAKAKQAEAKSVSKSAKGLGRHG
jgi:hypothetical protein